MKYLETLLHAAAAGETVFGYPAEDILFRAALTFVPLVDPDGVDLVTGALPEGEAKERTAAIAAAFPGIPYPDGWKANIAGIDLNLQYPAGWDTARADQVRAGLRPPRAARLCRRSAAHSAGGRRACRLYRSARPRARAGVPHAGQCHLLEVLKF